MIYNFFNIKEKVWQKYNIPFLPKVLFNFHESDPLPILQMKYLYVM